MERTPVTSSSIASVGHDPESNTLHVEFTNGKVYEYPDVDADTHRDLVNADSIGQHFNRNIRKRGGTLL